MINSSAPIQLTALAGSSRFRAIQEPSPAATPEELVVIDHLLEGWMEIYERSIFNGKTLDEILDLN